MKSRDEAVSYLLERGVYAAKRDWGLGETVVVASNASTETKSGITIYARCVYIIPVERGWLVERQGPVAGAEPRRETTLHAACEAALEFLAVPEPMPPGKSFASVDDALALLVELGGVPHLVKHHRLVAEAATELCDGLVAAGLDGFDRAEVLVGAALHDAGKTLHPNEMHGGGSEHERAGHRLLLEHGVPEHISRHAWMHAAWGDLEELEPILVALADKLWKGKRVADLEERAARLLAAASGRDFWSVWSEVDPVFEGVATSGDERLARSVLYP